MKRAVDNMKNGLRSFRKYVPADLVAELITLRKEAVLGAEKREATVFFSDIEDFTAISERLTPEALAEHLAVYFEGMTKIILRNRGTVDKYIGDAIMAFWGAPTAAPEHALLACRCALQCRSFLNALAGEAARSGAPVFRTRMGINSGELIVGNMGYEERMNYTVIGDHVNLASRLEGLNKYYGTQIIISQYTYAEVKGAVEARMIDVVAVKGRKQGVILYELVSEKDDLEKGEKSFIDLFNEGMVCYLERRWSEAIRMFQETSRKNPLDKPSQMLLERCRAYASDPPPGDWNGVVKLTQK
jgi:adenylate cyclase